MEDNCRQSEAGSNPTTFSDVRLYISSSSSRAAIEGSKGRMLGAMSHVFRFNLPKGKAQGDGYFLSRPIAPGRRVRVYGGLTCPLAHF